MKKHFSYLLAITFSIFLASCDKNEPSYSNYYTALGFIDTTAENSRGYIIDLDLDSDPNLVPVEIYDHHFDAEHGERVLVVFSLYNDNDINEDSADAVIHSITAVTYKDAVAYNDSIAEDLGKNAIYVEENSVWQNDNILNVIVGYWGSGYVRHTVNLVTPEELEVDTLGNYIIDLYHNNNGDAGSVYFEGIISFDLNSLTELIPAAQDGIGFVIRFNKETDNTRTLNKIYSYPFVNEDETISTNFESTLILE